jgi:hypothetical protein
MYEQQQTKQLKKLQFQCGTYAIARMMERQGYPLYMALHYLARNIHNSN